MLTWDQIKSKSTKRLVGLHPVVLTATTVLIERCYARGVPILITQGLRTFAEQNALYEQGRTKPGAIVTNARGGYSYHNYGLAIDFALLLPNGSSVSWNMLLDSNNNQVADWQEVAKEAKALGFEWGGDWTGFKDYPHFQMTLGLTLTQLRAGVKPSEIAIAKAMAVINRLKEEAEKDMSKIEALEAQVKELAAAVTALTDSKDVLKKAATEQGQSITNVAGKVEKLEAKASLAEIPNWAQDAVQAAFDAGLIDTPSGGSQDFYRIITVLDRAGLLITRMEDK